MKKRFYKIIISNATMAVLCLIAHFYIDIPTDKTHLLGDDYRLFQGTPAWKLAKAVKRQNVKAIRHQVEDLKIPIDYKEEKFGSTLLILAVNTNKKKSVETLLSLGANPNLYDGSTGNVKRNSVYYASYFPRPSTDILKLLLQYGGDPNTTEQGYWINHFGEKVEARNPALSEATFNGLEKVKILVEYGADVNKKTSTCPNGAMWSAIAHDKMDVLLYLLEHGADAHQRFERSNYKTSNVEVFYVDILYELRFCVYPLDSQEYKDKLKVIAFLKQNGLDYWKSPIPEEAEDVIKRLMKAKRINENYDNYIKKY